MPKVSIIIPVYNSDKFLSQCLDSVVNQSLKDIEIICINDGSTDDSLKIIEGYETKDNRIKIIDQINSGVSKARNVGLQMATGEYVAFIDSDDFVSADFYEKLYAVAKKKDLDIVKGNVKKVYDSKEETDKENSNIINSKIAMDAFNTHWYSAIYNRTNLIEKYQIRFPERITYKEDMVFLFNCKLMAKNFDVISDSYYYHVMQRKDSLTGTFNVKYIYDIFYSIVYRIEILNNLELSPDLYIVKANQCLNYILLYSKVYKINKFENDQFNKILDIICECYNICKHKDRLLSKFTTPLLKKLISTKQELSIFLKEYAQESNLLSNVNITPGYPPVSSDLCCGCTSCTAICPKKAIVMKPDHEGFLTPFYNESLCIHCGMCQKVCPILHNLKHLAPTNVLASWIKDSSARCRSSSGGVSYILASETLKKGGVVVGAAMDNFVVHHVIIEDEKALSRIQGSKYVQSDLSGIFQQVKKILDTGRYVMFTGTPCQVSGFRNFLQNDYSNLLTVDCICHGVPSPGVLKRYIDELKEQYYTATSLTFRDKKNGWNPNYAITLFDDDNEVVYRDRGPYNLYLRGFLRDIINRKSCAKCPFTKPERTGDITLGDFWKIGDYAQNLNDKKGTSLVFINTNKGNLAYKAILNYLAVSEEVPLSVAVAAQNQLRAPARSSYLRNEFFEYFKNNGRVSEYLNRKAFNIGILNFHFANNFGAVLVPFALLRVVEKMGLSGEIINYFGEKPPLDNNFEAFRAKYMKRSRALETKADLEKLSQWWKYIIVGSDQVWKMFDTGIYMLNWAAGEKTLISYGASFGNAWYSGRIKKPEAAVLLQRFDAISVREKSGVPICKNDFNVPAIQVLDPTMLLTDEDYIKIIKDENPKLPQNKYIAVSVINRKNKEELQNNPDILSRLKEQYPFISALSENGKFRTVAGWLDIIRNSQLVITDSFHGIVFSIIFKKQFLCVVAKGVNGQDRIPSLLNTLHISNNRIYESFSDIKQEDMPEPIDYNYIYRYLNIEREKSLHFLKAALNKPISLKGYFYKITNPIQ